MIRGPGYYTTKKQVKNGRRMGAAGEKQIVGKYPQVDLVLMEKEIGHSMEACVENIAVAESSSSK